MDGFDQHRDDTPHSDDDQQDRGPTGAPEHDYGDPRVDSAVARTDGLDERPVSDHVEVFDEVHRSFRETLDDPESSASGA